jgi:hypothetical protein
MANLLSRLANFAKRNPDVATQVGAGSALAGGFGLLSGSVPAAAAYGAADFLAAYPATLAARKLGQKYITQPVKLLGKEISPQTLRGAVETTANLGSSIAAPFTVDAAFGRYLYPEPTVQSQGQQIMQEMQQRAAVNQLEGPQAVAPGTQFQMQGLEHTFLRNYVKPQNYMSSLMPGYDETLAQLRSPLGAQ